MRPLLERVEKMLAALEFAGYKDMGFGSEVTPPDGYHYCALCRGEEDDPEEGRHLPDCPLAQLLADVREELAKEEAAPTIVTFNGRPVDAVSSVIIISHDKPLPPIYGKVSLPPPKEEEP